MSSNLFEKIILKIFSKMTVGKMRLTMPSGEILSFGTGDDLRAEMTILHSDFFKKCVLFGDIGFGEAFVDGDWTTQNLTSVIAWFIANDHPEIGNKPQSTNWFKLANRIFHWMRDNHLLGSQKNIEEHYDLGNDFFRYFLDPTMTYSSAYFLNGEESLEQAQKQKYEILCRKLHLQPSDHVLEIGSGWGGFCEYAASKYGCKITSITISKEQLKYAQERMAKAGLTDRVEIKYCDYRHMTGSFDKIVSIEMIEAVGHRYYEAYFSQCQKLLKPEGLFAIQMILFPDQKYESARKDVDWIQKHIFPGSLLPSIQRVQQAIRKTGDLNMVNLEDMGLSYAKTLAMWRNAFNLSKREIQALGFDEAFCRKWNYYFSYCEAAFSMRSITVAQAVFARANHSRFNFGFQEQAQLVTQFSQNII